MNNINKLTVHQLTAAITREVAAHHDDHKVFEVTRTVLDSYRRAQSEAVAKLVYTASKSHQKNSVFKEGFAALAKQRDKVLEAVNLTRAVHGFQKYTIDELGVYSTQMEVMAGSNVWQSINTHHELVELFRKDRSRLDLLLAWGRSLAHGDEGLAAAKAMTPLIKTAYKQSLVGIGKAMHSKGNTKDLVPFGKGCWAVSWAADAYEAVMDPEGKKPGQVLRGVSDAIKAAISGAFFANRSATNDYQLAHIVQGHRTAWNALFPREDEATVHKGTDHDEHLRESRNEDLGSDEYDGADDVLVELPDRVLNLGRSPDQATVKEAQHTAFTAYALRAERLLEDAALLFGFLSCGVKDGEAELDTFDALKEVIYARLAASSKARKEAKDFDKALAKAIMVVQTAMRMDAVSRRTFLKAFEVKLPLDQAVEYLSIERKAAQPSEADIQAVKLDPYRPLGLVAAGKVGA